ncbi:PAS domain-containing sensor histidine kinase [Clostridium oryzae]|uniref:PAS domain-containing sensor histidine kinase n=1 Tax=Clostridium oryzae TaxID=1450648 RepID=UPI001FA8CB57|nr:PAS domain-containing sensor histidine kinase [Clostridium oryzae]
MWLIFKRISLQHKLKYVEYAEYFIYITVFSLVIYLTKAYQSNYKFLFLLVIITSTIQFGMKFGIIVTIISSLIILSMDIFYLPYAYVNKYFENDFIIVAVFLLVMIPLGHYVKFEMDYLKKKEEELTNLNNELIRKDNDRKSIEQSILKNELCFNLLFENSREAIIVHTKDEIIYTNTSAAKMFGVTNENEIKLKSINNLLCNDDDKEDFRAKMDKLYERKMDMLTFENMVLLDNKPKTVKNISTYFVYEGKATILTILEDITSEKQIEKLESDVKKNVQLLIESRNYNQIITEFFSNISHELKTPLNVIYTALQVLRITNGIDKESISKREKYEDIIRQNCYRLMRLINNLLDITKYDSGFLKLCLKNYDIVEMVENIVLSVVPYAESRDIELIFDTEVEEKTAALDADMMERVILNLLSNAIKFTGSKGKILVNLYDFGDYVKVSVKDNGIGIPKEKIKSIFNRFEQIDKSLTRNREGTGIGLSLVKSFVELHKGTIEVNSEEGKGSEFIVTIPINIIDSTQKDTDNKEYGKSYIERINIEFSDIYSSRNE